MRAETSRPIEAYNRLPLRFEPNRGQRSSAVDFVSRGPNHELLLSSGEAVLALGSGRSASVRLQWIGAAPAKRIEGAEELGGRSNYFIGNDSNKWLTDIPNYAQARYEGLYAGIDLVFHGKQGQLEFDYVVSPRVDPAAIRLRVEGANFRMGAEGDLVLSAGGAEVRMKRPYAYQESAGLRRRVEARYALRHGNEIGFRLGRYDRALPLVIDPVLTFSTLLGGKDQEGAAGVALDSAGNIYLTGYTLSSDFPVLNSLQPFVSGTCYSHGGWPPDTGGPCSNVFISKLDPTGTTLLYSTYLGGDGSDRGVAIAVDDSGNVYVTGSTVSNNFPTAGAYPPVGPRDSTFVVKLGPTGNLLYSTYPGGAAIAADRAGNAYVAGSTHAPDFPTVRPLQSTLATAWLFRSSDGGATWGPIRTDGVLAEILQLDPTNPLTMYGGDLEEFWKTEDGGTTWQLILSPQILKALGVSTSGISGISIDIDSPSTTYAALGQGGVAKSLNGGDSWSPINEGLTLAGGAVSTILVDPARTATLYAATTAGVFRSTDAGAHWQPTPPVPGDGSPKSQDIRLLLADPLDPSAIYAAGQAGVFKLSNDGALWTALNSGLPGPYYSIQFLVLDPRNPLTLYASGDALWKSSNGGASWAKLDVPGVSLVDYVAVDPRTSTLYVGYLSRRMLSSADGGATWSTVALPVSGAVRSLAFVPSAPLTIYATVDMMAAPDAFLAKFGPTGALVYSTYLGGTDTDDGYAVAVDSSGSVYVAGATSSMDFPSPGAIQRDRAGSDFTGSNVFVAKLNPAGSALVWSTVLGGSQYDGANALALDSSGNVYITGTTQSSDFPTFRALQESSGGDWDAFVAELDAATGALVYSTYLGGSGGDSGYGVAVGPNGSAYVVGQTSSADFPLKSALQATFGGWKDAFVAKLNPSGTALVYSTVLGGSDTDAAYAVAVDGAGSAYVAGETYSSDFSGIPLQPFSANGSSAFVVKVAADPNIEAVVNAASYAAEPGMGLAPGTTVAIFGDALATRALAAPAVPLPRVLLDTTVTFNGIPAPLFFVSGSQVNAQIPFELTGGTASVVVKRGTLDSPAFQVRLAEVSPGVFSMNMQGTGDAIIVHASDFRLVTKSDPAVPGEYLTFYATGLGQLTAPVPTGNAPPQPFPEALSRPQVTISGIPAFVSWAGAAPTLVGVFQVNILMPEGVPAGEQVLQLTTNGIPANPVSVAAR